MTSGKHCETELSVHPMCENHPCSNNGTCRVLPNSQTYECDCLEGFSGQHCETNQNDCESSPCLNAGRCIDGVGDFTCDCSGTGYSGNFCQNNIDECIIKNPCLNNGICYDNYGSYVCDCGPGFGGQNCHIPINECQTIPCLNGGSCSDLKGSYRCICPSGFTGIYCQNAPQCPQCPSDSECLDGKCVCKPGTTGKILLEVLKHLLI